MPGKHQKDYYQRHREEILRAYSLGFPTPKRGRKKETQQINIES